MPSYELALILRVLPTIELKAALKRVGESIITQGGLLHKIENLGSRQLPVRLRKHNVRYRNGSYFLLSFDSRPGLIDNLVEEYSRDIDILRPTFTALGPPLKPVSCTLEEDFLPPAYRPDVKKLIEEGRRREPKRFKTHVDFYPF